ncbi:hypothetical protein EU805_01855 [Salipiger sp. IMCC34102]|uniref:hypothetical protein n=1 Tax=Salipiger sp. IMCC34102 TaxID=2510647 RepID=UPI00101C7C88|nr:hypothetical protein [Salipiger sp. IMCC34102]RYH04140.1 hypothetical protein EU805_01855 [Salipiger sp. IMCC34102]
MSMGENARRGADLTVSVGKVIGALSVICTVAVTAWAQFLGPGLWQISGLGGLEDRLFERIDEKIDPLASDVAFILRNMPPPKVVEWDESVARQDGACISPQCEYILGGSRTAYGETCGKPTIVRVELRGVDGRMFDIAFEPDWIPTELRRTPVTFSVPLDIPAYVPDGVYTWRSLQLYESCTGVGEPIVRMSPWWPLVIGDDRPPAPFEPTK